MGFSFKSWPVHRSEQPANDLTDHVCPANTFRQFTIEAKAEAMSVYEIGIVFTTIGETPYDIIDRYKIAGVTFDEALGSPLAQFLAIEFPRFDIELVNFNGTTPYKNGVRLADNDERQEIIVRLPKAVQMVEDYWPEMTTPHPTAVDNWIVMSRSVDEQIDRLNPPPPHKPDWHPSYGHLHVV